mmetsp:Transcript_35370/g.88054  ORF Transcript_35370/g.88054 Transcript_35370/m.88054 type:complete len:207 (-) Transcript_35370:890-1510(-)
MYSRIMAANSVAVTLYLAVGSSTGASASRRSRIRLATVNARPFSFTFSSTSAPFTSLRAAASNALAHVSARARKSASLVQRHNSAPSLPMNFASVVSGKTRSFTAATAASLATSLGSVARVASSTAEASSHEKLPTRRNSCRPGSSGSSATANELLSTTMAWQSPLSCVSCLACLHTLAMSLLSPDLSTSITTVGRQSGLSGWASR